MADPQILLNITAYALQVACVTALAELLFRVLPVAAAGFRYAYWRLVLVTALVLPWLLRASPAVAPAPNPVVASVPALSFIQAADVSAVAAASPIQWPSALLWIFGIGFVLRFLWLVAGIARLRALRRGGAVVRDCVYDEVQERLGTQAELRSVSRLNQPVTFGLRRPVVLLPVALADADESIRRAAVTHELIHVLRRDWLSMMSEELLRAVFWWHPAVWWLTARIRLTREEFTDHLAVLATGSRRSYMEALLAFADNGLVGPAPAFVRRAHLFHRIVLLSKESFMTSRRIVASGVALTLLLGAGSWFASDAFPIVAASPRPAATAANGTESQAGTPAQQATQATAENPIPRRLAATPIGYPLELAGSGFESAISVRVVVNANGFVNSAQAGARSVSAPGRAAANSREESLREQEAMERFAAAAVEAINQWHYEPPARAPIAFYVGVLFKPGVPATASEREIPFAVSAGPAGARLLVGFSDTVTAREIAQAGARGRGASPGGGVPPGPQGRGGQPAGARQGGAVGGAQEPLRVAPPPPPPPPAPGAPVRIGGAIRAPVQTRKVAPVYPAIAQSARVQGVVILEAIIDEQGRVTSARVLRSIPLLDQAALDAVRQWEYTPVLLNGAPTPVIMTVTVQFALPEPVPQN
jgi:protein TonB